MKKAFTTGENHENDKTKRLGGVSLVNLSFIPIIIAGLLILFSGFAAYLQYSNLADMRTTERHQAEAQRMAAYLSGRMQSLGDEIARLARPDEILLGAIQRQDRIALRILEQRLMQRYPSALRISYILPSDEQPEADSNLPLGYASLDMARIAESGELPPIEVHRFGTQQQHLIIARAVHQQDEIIATLVIMLDAKLLGGWLADLQIDDALVQLRQGNLQLAQLGNPALGSSQAPRVAVQGTGWEIQHWPNDGFSMDTARKGGFVLSFILTAVILIGLLLFHSVYLSRSVRADMHRMVEFIVDSSLGKQFHSYPVVLSETKTVLEEKETDLSVLSSNANVLDSYKNIASDADMPDMLFGEDDGFVVIEEEDRNK
jgi:hypothetical protein